MNKRALALLSVVVLLLQACSEGGEEADESGNEAAGFQPCAYISQEEVVEVTGLALIEDQEVTGDSLCSFILDSGPTGLTIQIQEAPTPVEFSALLPVDVQTSAVEVEGADQAFVWSSSEVVQEGLVRVGGSTARVTIVWDSPPTGTDALQAILQTVAPQLPDREFEESEAPGEATCASLDVDVVREALGLPELTAAPAGSSTSCALSDAASGVNLLVDLPEGAASQEQLDLDGRSSEIDGETYEWTVEAVPGVGDGALWTLDPVSERTGELVALFGEQLVRVTSSANEPGEAIKSRAVTVAQIAGGTPG